MAPRSAFVVLALPSRAAALVLIPLLLLPVVAVAADWPAWRGVAQDGSSDETGLISSWDPASGENRIFRADFIGRSTPVVFGGRVFVMGRAGTGIDRREIVAAFDAETGKKLWERNVTVANTTVPFNRAGWASLVGDRETGYVYAQGMAGPLVCYDRDGNVIWERDLSEEFGRYSGYGGRTQTPLVDEDQLIVSIINTAWGELGPPRHRYYSFDKRTGDVLWISTPGGAVGDLNAQSHGVVAVIGGRRLFIGGNADGFVYALQARTGVKVWQFELSKRGLNSTPVVAGNTIFIGHSEENVDEGTLGRTVAIDGTGTGDVTKTHELWRRDIKMGFPSPLVHGDRVYVTDNSANLFALDTKTGETRWEYELGTVGKASPVWADGKIYATETNGHVHIVAPGESEATELDRDQLHMPDGKRYAEIYGSPAIAYGRIYFTTEEGLYCLGDKRRPFLVEPSPEPDMPPETRGSDDPAVIHVVPGDVTLVGGGAVGYEVRAFNETGRSLGTVAATWSLEGLDGTLSDTGQLTLPKSAGATNGAAGHVKARAGNLEASARVRNFSPLPFTENFDSVTGKGRPYWIGGGRFQVSELDGNKVLEKPIAPSGLLRSALLIGAPSMTGYTIQADVMGNQKGRRRTDVGLINNGYILDLLGNSQKLEIRTWSAILRMARSTELAWEMGKWYTMKLQVETVGGKAIVRGKVWPRGESEPQDWTLTAEDPLPIPSGSPGMIGYSPASIYYDNVEVTVN